MKRTGLMGPLWGSLYSLRHYHPEAKVVVLVDGNTYRRITTNDKLKPLCALITELIEVDVPGEFSGVLRSRDIKTRVRNQIDGDFLYVDTDTIIAAPLDGIDSLEVKNLAMVPDIHRENIHDNIWNIGWVKMIYGMEITNPNLTYFNAGVLWSGTTSQQGIFLTNGMRTG